MNINTVFIKNVGWVITELQQSLTGLITLTNPSLISGDGLIPMLHLVQEDSMVISTDDLVGNIFTPIPELLEAYSNQFSKVIVPEKKIILN